ncbi:bile acid:sodium symporter [Propioniciclava coleopterorum]|uniref:Bile acid:sodium symporter n=1 Tax=Propioniciclava coleopterorum TaxID=2714937 RepID=A0A6G7Y8R9_9ACTN|nr:bile acid:sodium symporter family protein [Propioniciclava coleopterorum]QIK73076.1 bile acid:sodium symporter [Propioniciclava coleopterorum]
MATRRFKVDYFLLAIIAAAVVASFLPASGVGATALSWATKVAIFCLFFLYGARLHPREALAGLKHWRLHLTILAFTFVAFPLLGLAIAQLPATVISAALIPGLLYVTLCPSTVQSSINFTSIAHGNVAGAIVSASASNLLGVFVTPLLAIALMNTSGQAHVGFGAIGDLMLQILLPFILGQLSRRWTADFVARHKKLKLFDQASIVLVVYSAFSEGVREGIWTMVSVPDIVALIVVCLVMLAFMLWLTWFAARRLKFNRADAIAIQFCGTKKSLATGLPMATVLFVGQPIGLIMLPLMVFHQAQLMACSWLATRYAREADAAPAVG